jgi:hypothetical protein
VTITSDHASVRSGSLGYSLARAYLKISVTNRSAATSGPRYLADMAWRGGAGVRITDILPVLTGIAVGVALNWDQSLGDRIVGGLLRAAIIFLVWRWLHR